MTRTRGICLCLALAALAVPAIVAAAPDGSADVRFGNPTAGTSFPPPSGHDRSFNGQDNLIPRTVAISAGGTVRYLIDGFHQPVVYRAGTRPEDIAILGGDFVDDPNGRVAIGPLNFPPATQTWATPAGTFASPGRYLVICNFMPHFAFANMYGWVNVT